jgi:hypothetical protein
MRHEQYEADVANHSRLSVHLRAQTDANVTTALA